MNAFDNDIFALLRSNNVLLAEIKSGSYLIDAESLQHLDALIRSLLVQNERLRDTIVKVLDRDPPVTRCSLKELKGARERLDRRLKHLAGEVSAAHAAGARHDETLLDRKEIGALGLALPILDACVEQAERENKEHPGGKRLRDLGR